MKCRIHRGCHEIGGNCVEIVACGRRIVLDVGLPLSGTPGELPDIPGLSTQDDSLLGVLISHPHPDHYGLLVQVPNHVPVYIGAAAHNILGVSAFFTRLPGVGDTRPQHFSDHVPIELGPFRVTPFVIDHSAYDSYCFLIEADGQRIFYSGDIRGHGRRSRHFDELVSKPPSDIDVLICEGTQIGREPGHDYPDEASVSEKMAGVFSTASGLGLVWCSSQNIDRIASVYDAAQRTDRRLILDVYTAEVLRATGDATLPDASQDDVSIYLPLSQKRLIKRAKAFDYVRSYYPHRIYPEELAEVAAKSVMIFRPSMLAELERSNCLDGVVLISSLWSGYLKRDPAFLQKLRSLGIPLVHVHTSGHATVTELKRFVSAFPKARVVPIHLEDREGFQELFPNAEPRNDGEWWEI